MSGVGQSGRDRAGWLGRNAERISGALPAVREGFARQAATAALVLIPLLALAKQSALSPGSEVTAEDAVRLFDAVCLVNHPDFKGSASVLDDYGFTDLETAIHRQHPEKMLQAVVMPLLPAAAAGARSCAVMAAGIGFTEVGARLEPLIAERLGQPERHQDAQIALPHAVWVSRTDNLQTKIILVEQGGGSVIAASVTPLQEQEQ